MQPNILIAANGLATLRWVGTFVLIAVFCITKASSAGAGPLTLEEAVREALINNPVLAASRENVVTSQAMVSQERSRSAIKVAGAVVGQAQQFAPEIPAANGLPARALGDNANGYLDVSAEKLLYSSGKAENAVKAALNALSVEQLRCERLTQQVVSDTKSAYYDLLASHRNLETAKQDVLSTEEHLRIAQVRLKADTAPKFDVIRAEVQLAEARQRILDAENAVTTRQQTLITLMGRPDLDIGDLVTKDTAVTPKSLDELLAVAHQQRPDLLAARQAVIVAQAGLGVARAESKPEIRALTGYKTYAAETPLQLNGWYAWLGVKLPILDGGFSHARRQEARSAITKAQANVRATENEVISNVKQKYSDLTSAVSRENVALAAVSQAEEAYRLASLRYEAGVSTSVEVTDAQSTLTRARNDLVRSRLDISTASARLELAVGKQLTQPGGND